MSIITKSAVFLEDLARLTKDRKLAQEVCQLIEQWESQEKNKKKERQKNGIKKAKDEGVTFGRPKIKEPDNFNRICDQYIRGELSASAAALLCGMGVSTFYRRIRDY